MIRVVQRPIPNWGGRVLPRVGCVLHVAEGSAASVDSWFAADVSDVSAHFLVTLAGQVHQYVSVHERAWHAGRVLNPTWKWLTPGTNPNDYLLGVEHEGSGATRWPEAQLYASSFLAAWLARRFGWDATEQFFPLHRAIYAGKTCPGPAFGYADYLERVRAVLALSDPTTLIEGIR